MTGVLGGGTWLALGLLLGLGVGVALMLGSQRRRDARVREAQEALRVSEDRLRRALDATSEIVWDWDLASDSIYHPSWAQTYGFPEERTPRTGQQLGPFIHPEDMPLFQGEMGKLIDGAQETFEVEHRALTGTGEWKWMLGRARAVSRDAAGKVTRVVGTCTDVTERKRMLARLQISDRMASIGTLAVGVAHEINNPLSYVIGNVEFSRQRLEALEAGSGSAPDAARDTLRECLGALRDAQGGAERVRDIVADVKLFSRAAATAGGWSSRCATRAAGSPRGTGTACSTPSSRPSRWGWGPGSGSPSATGS